MILWKDKHCEAIWDACIAKASILSRPSEHGYQTQRGYIPDSPVEAFGDSRSWQRVRIGFCSIAVEAQRHQLHALGYQLSVNEEPVEVCCCRANAIRREE